MVTLTERFNRFLFQRAIKDMLDTPPLKPGSNPFAALTMVHRRDVLPYLLAIKTFARFAGPERVILVADPSLTSADKSFLRTHIPCIEIVEAVDFQRPDLPIGGTWERLSAISILSSDAPIVQLDADTVTFACPDEVIDCMRDNRCFVIRSEHNTEIQTLDEAAQHGDHLLTFSQHVVAYAEAALTKLPNWRNLRYVRGCSGFTGFGKGTLTPAALNEFSRNMRDLIGAKWDKWGSEQVSSNLLAASTPDCYLLPHPKYCNADGLTDETVVAHFIGYTRYVSRTYERLARQAAQHLREAAR